MTDTDFEHTKEIIFAIIAGLLIGSIVTFTYMANLAEDTPDDIVEHFESFLKAITKIRPDLVNDQTTIGEARDKYFHYYFISESLLRLELQKVCRGNWQRDINNTDIGYQMNETVNQFCVEVCPA